MPVEHILIVASTVQAQQRLRTLLAPEAAEIQCAHSGGQARRMLGQQSMEDVYKRQGRPPVTRPYPDSVQ